MALVIRGKTRCVLSGKVITGEQDFLGFPPFPCDADDPAIVCYDACVLREEFERWEFRNSAVERVSEFWVQWYRMSKGFTILSQDSYYLLARSRHEEKVRMIFLRHVFVVDVPNSSLESFVDWLAEENATRFSLYSITTLSFTRGIEEVTMCQETEGSGRDCVRLSLPEWEHLQSLLSAHKDLFE